MRNFALIYPMFAMVVLTFAVLLTLFKARAGSVKRGDVKPAFFKLYQGSEEPDKSAKLARHFANIFEAPTLFYVACLGAMITGQDTLSFLILAWLYVILRAGHAYIHTGKNKITPRIYIYFSSWAVLLAMWGYTVVRLAIGPGWSD